MCEGFVKPHRTTRARPPEKHWFQQRVQQETSIIRAETTPPFLEPARRLATAAL